MAAQTPEGEERAKGGVPPFARFSPPGFRVAIFFSRGFLSRHARRTKQKSDYS